MLEAIQARLAKPAFSLSGQLSLKELAALTQAAKLFIGVDSAPMHIAAAVGTPTVALFGPSGDKQWGPWSANSRVVASQCIRAVPAATTVAAAARSATALLRSPSTT